MIFHSTKFSAFIKAGYCIIIAILYTQQLCGQARVFVNPGLEFGVTPGTVDYLDTNFGFGSTFDAGSAITAPWHTTQSQNNLCSQPTAGNCHAIVMLLKSGAALSIM